jgi:hypothetical protein
MAMLVRQVVTRWAVVCDEVRALDHKVWSGAVRRQAAAHMASLMWTVDSNIKHLRWFDSNFLRVILTVNRHAVDCACLYLVLAWGCCPTRVMRYPCPLTALGFYCNQAGFRIPWARALLEYGAMPWVAYGVFARSRGLGLMAFTPSQHLQASLGGTVAVARWRRWHGRRRRRLWVVLFA